MVRFGIVVVTALFVGAQLFQWLKGIILPLPIYVIAGAFLAIASNYEKGIIGWLNHRGDGVLSSTQASLGVNPEQETTTAKLVETISSPQPISTPRSLPEFADNAQQPEQGDAT